MSDESDTSSGTREEQVKPKVNNTLFCQDTLSNKLIIVIAQSKKRGIETYGTALQPFNGRSADRDAFEEWIDLGMYLEQIRREREAMANWIEDMLYALDSPSKSLIDLKKSGQAILEGLGRP